MEDVDFVREVYDASYRRLVTQLAGVTGSLAEAEDVVQEAFVRAVTHARTVRRADNPEAWLRRVAVNVARSRHRGSGGGTGWSPGSWGTTGVGPPRTSPTTWRPTGWR